MRVPRKKLFFKAVSAAISLQMVCAVAPQLSTAVFAEANYYLNEDFSNGLGKWTNADDAEVMTNEDTAYMHYSSDASSSVATRSLDNAISKGADIYIAEFDVRFEDGNSGVVELYGGTKLGPTIIFDGSKIKTKTGNPSTYVTMYDNAQAGKWYNVKFIADGTNSMYGYTTDIETDGGVQKTRKDVKRNLSSTQLTKINVTNKVNAESEVRSGAVDVRNLKVYKPLPDNIEMSVDGDVKEISVPQTDAASTVKFNVGKVYQGAIDLSDYSLLAQEILCFKLYDKNNKNEVSPEGVSINKMTGILSVTSEASGVSEGTYTVRLTNYDNSAYASVKIEVVRVGEAASIELTTAPTRIGVPNAGAVNIAYGATLKDKYGSEMSGVAVNWSIVDENGNAISDDKLTIDNSGVVTAYAGAQTGNVRIKAASMTNSEIYALSGVIDVYQMTAKTITINGDNYFAVPNSGSEAKMYTTQIFDQYGVEMPAEEEKIWTVDNSGVSLTDGVLTVNAGTTDSNVTITVTSGGVSAQKTVTVYNPVLSTIAVEGDRSIEIPARGTKNFTYIAKSYDQYDFEIDCNGYSWGMTTDDNTALSMSGATVTVGANAKEQMISIIVSSGNVSGTLRVVVTKNPFTYKPVDGGFEIDNGKKNYTRPIYAPHINDDLIGLNGKVKDRYIYYLGDQPKLVLTNVVNGNDHYKFANMFLGIKGGKWLDRMSNITARYVNGHEEYVITDSSFEGEIRLTYTRSNELDAMLIKAELPDALTDKLVAAVGGQGGVRCNQPTGGSVSTLEFSTDATANTEISVEDNVYSIAKNKTVTVSGTASVPMTYTQNSAMYYETDVDTLLESETDEKPMLVGTTEGNTENEVYLLITTEDTDNEYIKKYQTDSKEMFENGIRYYESVAKRVEIDTPDPYVNSAIRAQVVATDASWDWPIITHGPMGWHVDFGGWRGHYGFVDAGWGDRIETNTKQFIKTQKSDGRIQAYATKDARYNMSIVLVDALLQNWEWTGNDEFFTDEGGYDFVAGHLKFMDTYMQVPDSNLYENFLDAWNTDNKWNNGAAGSIATAYTWRAYNTMAKLAEKLGKTEDAAAYRTKADAIKADMNELLWDSDTGVFGEYRERFGYGRLNTAPDLSSIYTPIDMGVADWEQAYQALRFSDYAIPSIDNQDKIWGGIDFKYSSNRLPVFYSSDGLYPQEVLNNALAYYETGQRDMAMKQFKACFVQLMKGSAAGQGTVGHTPRESLENNGHIDFADASSQYVRTAVEGLFGIKMNVPDGVASITPGFPDEWEHSSIKTTYLSYDYKYENNTDIFNVTSEKELSYEMHISTRSSKIESVTVNDDEAEFTVDGYVNVSTPIGKKAEIRIKYADDESAKIVANKTGGTHSGYTVKSNGTITAVSDPQGVLAEIPELNKSEVAFTLADKEGNHTFFVTVEKNDMTAVLPVDVLIKSNIEITDAEIVTGTNAGINVKLTNNTEETVTINAALYTVSGNTSAKLTIPAKGSSNAILVPVENKTDLTPGDNKVTAVISGDINKIITGKVSDWDISGTASGEKYQTISLDSVVNQDLRTLHENSYDMTYDGDEHYRLPNFYWSSGSNTPRTILKNGRSWWEPSKTSHAGDKGVPSSLSKISGGGAFKSDIGVPFEISSKNGNNAAFVSLYNRFPDKINIPVNIDGSKIYFMLSVSTNNMQSRIENARITVNFADGTSEVLPLTNPDNIDDWLCYQLTPYAETGYTQMLDDTHDKAHANILTLDLGEVQRIESIDFECLANEVLAGILGVTVVTGEYTEPLTVGEITFDKTSLTANETITASVNISNDSISEIFASMMIALYDKNGTLKGIKMDNSTIAAKSAAECSVSYTTVDIQDSDYIKAFLWNGTDEMKPLTEAKTLK